MDIEKVIRNKKPNLSASSMKLYVGVLRRLGSKLDVEPIQNFNYLTKFKRVIKILPTNKNTLKTYLAVIVVAMSTDPKYRKALKMYQDFMETIAYEYSQDLEKQEKTEKQKAKWCSWEKLQKKTRQRINDVKRYRYNQQDALSKKSFQYLQDTLILSLYITQPPRRLEYGNMKIIKFNDYLNLDDEEETKNNWLIIPRNKKQRKYFLFNVYKTKKSYGTQMLRASRDVNYLVNVWIKHNKTKYFLLSNKENKPLSMNGLTQRLKSITREICGKAISVSMLRHIFISEKVLKDAPMLKDLQNIAESMGHSLEQQQLYRKT